LTGELSANLSKQNALAHISLFMTKFHLSIFIKMSLGRNDDHCSKSYQLKQLMKKQHGNKA